MEERNEEAENELLAEFIDNNDQQVSLLEGTEKPSFKSPGSQVPALGCFYP